MTRSSRQTPTSNTYVTKTSVRTPTWRSTFHTHKYGSNKLIHTTTRRSHVSRNFSAARRFYPQTPSIFRLIITLGPDSMTQLHASFRLPSLQNLLSLSSRYSSGHPCHTCLSELCCLGEDSLRNMSGRQGVYRIIIRRSLDPEGFMLHLASRGVINTAVPTSSTG